MNFKEYIHKNITLDDFSSQNMRLLAEQCGIESTLNLMDKMDGIVVYIPSVQKGLMPLLLRYIKENYDGSRDSINRIARECSISCNLVTKLLWIEMKNKQKEKNAPKQ